MTDPVPLLARLIASKSQNPGGDEPALATLLAAELLARGAAVETGGDHETAYVYGRFGSPTLLVNAHLDTVPPNAGWSADPHVARVTTDRVTGLGACDTKGAIAAILAALDDARPNDVGVLFSGDEEHGGRAMRLFLESPHSKGLSRAIVCEPTACRVGVRHRGIVAMEAKVSSEGGHSSRADLMVSPLAELARVAVALDDWGRALRDHGSPGFQGMCVNVAKLEGGVAFNVVPTEATLAFSVRPPPGADAKKIRAELEALVRRASPHATPRMVIENATFHTRDAAAFVPLLGAPATEPIDLGFWTEAAMLSAAGIDAVVYGPGEIGQAHAADEWVAVEQLLRARDGFLQIFRNSAEGPDGRL